SQDGLLIRNFFFQLGLRLSLKEEHLAQLSAEREESKRESQRLEETIRIQEREVREAAVAKLDQEIANLREERQKILAQKDEEVSKLVTDMERLGQEQAELRHQLGALETSLAWRLNLKCRQLRDSLFREGTKRRALFDRVKDAFKVLIR